MAREAEFHERAEMRLARLARLQDLTAELSAAATPPDVARIIFDRGLSLVGARAVALFWERAEGSMELVHGLGLSEEFVQRFRRIGPDAVLPSAEVYRTGAPVWLGTAEELRRRFPAAAELAAAEGDRAWAAIPLGADRSRGALSLRFDTERTFDAEEREFLLAVARQCAQALERARLFEAQRLLADRLASLQAITSELSAALTPREVAAVVLRHLLALGARGGAVLSLDLPRRLEPVFAHAADDLRDALLAAPEALQLPGLDDGQPIWLDDPAAIAAAVPGLAPVCAARGDGALCALPLRMEGRNVGVLVAAFPAGSVPGPDDRAFARALAQQGAQALERARLFEAQRLQAERLAHLQSATAALSGAASPDEVAVMAHRRAGAAGGGHRGAARLRGARPAGPPGPARRAGREGAGARRHRGCGRGGAQRQGALVRPGGGAGRAVPGAGGRTVRRDLGAGAVARRRGHHRGAGGGAAGRERIEPDERVFVRMLAMPCAQALERVRLAELAAQERRAAEWLAALLEGALTAAPVGLALLDDAMRVIRTSERLARLAGVPQEAQRGKTPLELFPGLPGRGAPPTPSSGPSPSGERVDQQVSGRDHGRRRA